MESTPAIRPDDVPIENTPTARPREALTGSVSSPGGKKTKSSVSSSNSVPTGGRIKDGQSRNERNDRWTRENGSGANGLHSGSRKKESLTSPGSQTSSRGKESISSTGSGHSAGKGKESVSSSVQTSGSRTKDSVSSTSSVLSGGKKTTKSQTKPLYFWNSGDVNKWFKKHALHLHQLYGDTLLQQDVTGRTLIRMNDIKLEKIGIKKPEHRNDMMQYILRLRLRHELSDLKNLDQKGIGFELKLPEKSKFQSKDSKDKHSK